MTCHSLKKGNQITNQTIFSSLTARIITVILGDNATIVSGGLLTTLGIGII